MTSQRARYLRRAIPRLREASGWTPAVTLNEDATLTAAPYHRAPDAIGLGMDGPHLWFRFAPGRERIR